MQDSAAILKKRILHEILGRGWSFTIPQIPLALVFLLFIPSMYHENLAFLLAILAIGVGTVMFMLPKFKFGARIKDPEACFLVSVALISVGWSVVLAAFFRQHGMMAPVSLLTAVIVCGVTAGAFIILTPHKTLFYTYFIPMALIPSLCSLGVLTNLQDFTLLILMGIYNIFLMFSAPPIRQRFQSSILSELRLAEERDKTEALMNAFPGIVSVLDENQTYRMMNRFGLEMLGRADVVGQPLGFITPEDEFVRAVREFFLKPELPRLTQEVRISTTNEDHWFLVSMSRMQHPAGWVVAVSVDIDELVNARQIAEDQKTKTSYAARLASLGEMAQGIAHEINNPLAVVMFSAEEIIQRSRRNELTSDFVENFSDKILVMTTRIAKIVKGLRYFSRDAEKDPFRSLPVAAILEQTIEFRAEKCKQYEIKLEVSAGSKELLVNCREVQIMQALNNLLINSFDAVVGEQDPWIRIEAREAEDFVQILVSDSGKEIEAEVAKKMFEPFYSTKEVGQGTGLGLSIALGLLQGNHGDVKYLGSKPTRFEISIPKAR
jgi:signal transduction histidine kinase